MRFLVIGICIILFFNPLSTLNVQGYNKVSVICINNYSTFLSSNSKLMFRVLFCFSYLSRGKKKILILFGGNIPLKKTKRENLNRQVKGVLFPFVSRTLESSLFFFLKLKSLLNLDQSKKQKKKKMKERK